MSIQALKQLAGRPARTPQDPKEGWLDEPTPRPKGLNPAHQWVPRTPTRNKAAAAATATALELIERLRFPQPAWAGIRRIFKPQTPVAQVADIASQKGSWTFGAIGDYGHTSKNSAGVAAQLIASKPELIVTTGDNVYATGREIDYKRNFDPIWGPVAKQTMFYPSVGNHDLYRDDLTAYFKRFPHLDNRSYYSFKHKNAEFFALASDEALTPGSPQLTWLGAELSKSKSPWKVVYMHYPIYGNSKEGFADLRANVQPLLAKHGVQLMLAGHEHSYSRSNPIDGVMHIVTGGGGQEQSVMGPNLNPWQAKQLTAYHHLEIAVGATQMVVRAINDKGVRFDAVKIPLKAGMTDAQDGARQLATPVSSGGSSQPKYVASH